MEIRVHGTWEGPLALDSLTDRIRVAWLGSSDLIYQYDHLHHAGRPLAAAQSPICSFLPVRLARIDPIQAYGYSTLPRRSITPGGEDVDSPADLFLEVPALPLHIDGSTGSSTFWSTPPGLGYRSRMPMVLLVQAQTMAIAHGID
jgi:hypothetical protein